MIHYHGGSHSTWQVAVEIWKRRHALISFADPQQIATAAEQVLAATGTTPASRALEGPFNPTLPGTRAARTPSMTSTEDYMRILLALALCAGAVAAGDLTGKWKGTAEITAPDGRAMSRPVLMDLVQNGGSVTGKMGPDEQRMQPVQNAKLEGNALTFDSPMGPDRTAKVALTVVDDKTMEGTLGGTMHTGDAIKAKVKFVREAAAAAGGFTGTWSGTADIAGAHGSESGGAYCVLKQKGSELTGTAGPDQDKHHTITNGKVEGDTATFDLKVEDGPSFTVKLKLIGDKIEGTLEGTAPDGGKMTGKLSMTRKS